jgi:excisionase family DNA binding protein
MNAPLRKREGSLNPEHRGVFTLDELSAYLRIPKSSLYKLVRPGKIPSIKIGRHLRFSVAAIDSWLGESQEKRTLAATFHPSLDA